MDHFSSGLSGWACNSISSQISFTASIRSGSSMTPCRASRAWAHVKTYACMRACEHCKHHLINFQEKNTARCSSIDYKGTLKHLYAMCLPIPRRRSSFPRRRGYRVCLFSFEVQTNRPHFHRCSPRTLQHLSASKILLLSPPT